MPTVTAQYQNKKLALSIAIIGALNIHDTIIQGQKLASILSDNLIYINQKCRFDQVISCQSTWLIALADRDIITDVSSSSGIVSRV